MDMRKSILITLGHNSSVIYYDCENSPIGYEEERLTGKKSDSSYPINALEKILSIVELNKIYGAKVFISHWFDTFSITDFPEKYFNHEHFNRIVSEYGLIVTSLDESFTHHDAHAWSTLAFAENFENVSDGAHFIVADGFGNRQEVLSIYKKVGNSLQVVKKIYGYENSLGLMYQYATSFCGMKENQDEYKFLGYESLISTVFGENTEVVCRHIKINAIDRATNYIRRAVENTNTYSYTNEVIDLLALSSAKEQFVNMFDSFSYDVFMNATDKAGDEEALRICVGFYVQKCLEEILLRLIDIYHIEDAYISGGVFMNVKLNNVILNNIKGKICVNPLCGDQGAAIGLYRYYTGEMFSYTDLCWGTRNMPSNETVETAMNNRNIVICTKEEDFISTVSSKINSGKIVNIVQGKMEFGARALCNTSTLALPTLENVHYINRVNNRNEVMPMAPVLPKRYAPVILDRGKTSRVVGSNRFMIMAHDVNVNVAHDIRGVVHNMPLSKHFTCRPQILHSETTVDRMFEFIDSVCIINTSFNTHGRPILYSIEDCIEDFEKQQLLDDADKLWLVILLDKSYVY